MTIDTYNLDSIRQVRRKPLKSLASYAEHVRGECSDPTYRTQLTNQVRSKRTPGFISTTKRAVRIEHSSHIKYSQYGHLAFISTTKRAVRIEHRSHIKFGQNGHLAFISTTKRAVRIEHSSHIKYGQNGHLALISTTKRAGRDV